MAQNLTNFDEALKIDYLPVIREQLEHGTVLLDKVQRNERDVSGKRWQLTAHYQRNSGVGAGAETDLPTAGEQKYKNPYGTMAYNRGRIQVSGPVMQASRDDKGAIVRALESEIKGVTRDLKKDVNYQLNNDGTSIRCYVNGEPGTGTTLTVDTPGTQYLYEDMVIDIIGGSAGDDDGATNDADVTISSVDSSTQVTVSAALDAAIDNNDYVVRANSTDGSGYAVSNSYEMMGIKGIVDDASHVTTLHNLSRDTYNWWKCSTHSDDDNGGSNRDLTLDLIQKSVTAVEKNGGKVDLILSDHDLRDAYAALVTSDKRHVNTMELDGGWKALEYNGIPWVAEVDCQPDTIFFLDLDHLFIMQMGSWDWMDRQLCSSKIWLYAGKSDKSGGANYAKIRNDRQSAGKLNGLARWDNRRRRFFCYNPQVGEKESETVFLPRFSTSQHKSGYHRQGSTDNRQNLWLSYFRKTAKKQAMSHTMETQDSWLQTQPQVFAHNNTLFTWEKRGGRILAKICSDERDKQFKEAEKDEKTFKVIEESSETICQTVRDTEDIVRTVRRRAEFGRNVQALVVN